MDSGDEEDFSDNGSFDLNISPDDADSSDDGNTFVTKDSSQDGEDSLKHKGQVLGVMQEDAIEKKRKIDEPKEIMAMVYDLQESLEFKSLVSPAKTICEIVKKGQTSP